MRNDFKKFFRSLYPINSSLRMERGIQNQLKNYQSPYIIEERQLNVTTMDVFSRLMMERIIFLNDAVNKDTMGVIMAQILFLENQGNTPIRLYINSPGGAVIDGFAVIDTMKMVKSPVYTHVTGMAASMGAMLLACGEKGHRTALEHSNIMIHQPSGGSEGKSDDMEIALEQMRKCKKNLYETLASRTGKSYDEIEKACVKDNWMTPEEAKDFGLIDEILK